MNADERRRIEREVKEYNRSKQEFESRKEQSLISKTIGTAGEVAKSAAIIGGGFFLAKKGWQNYGRPAAKEFLGSKQGAGFVSTINKRLDEAGTVMKAFNETAKSTGLINTMSGRSNREFATKIAHQTRRKPIKPNGMSSIKANIEKVAGEYSNVREDIMRKTIRGTQKDEFIKKVQENASKQKLSKKDSNVLGNIVDAINSQFDTHYVKGLLEAGPNDKDKASFLDKVVRNAYADRKTGAMPKDILGKDGKIDDKFIDIVLKAANDVQINKDFNRGKIDAHTFFRTKKNSDNFLSKTGVSDEIQDRYNKLITQYNKAIGELLSGKKSDARELVGKGIDYASKMNGKVKSVVETAKEFDRDIGLRKLTVREAKEKGLLDYDVISSKAKKIDGEIVTESINMAKFIEDIEASMNKDNMSIMDSAFDPKVFINDSDEIVDLRAPKNLIKNSVNAFADNVQVPILNFNPVKLVRDMFTVPDDMPITAMFKSGEYMPSINNVKTMLTVGDDVVEKSMGLSNDYFYFAGKLYDKKGDFVREGYLYRSDRGLAKNTFGALVDNEEKTYKNSVFKMLDIGNQEDSSVLSRTKSIFGKFGDKYWQPNMIKNIDNATELIGDKEYVNRSFKSFYTTSLNSAKPLTGNQLEALRPLLNETFGDEDFVNKLILGSTDQNLMDSISYLIKDADKDKKGSMFLGKLQTIQNEYVANPEEFIKKTRTRVRKQEEWAPASLESMIPSKYDNVTAIDEAKIFLHSEVLNRVQNKLTSDMFGEVPRVNGRTSIAYDKAYDKLMSYLGHSDTEAVDSMLSLSYLQKIGSGGEGKYIQGDNLNESAMSRFLNEMISSSNQDNQGGAGLVRKVVRDNNSFMDYGPEDITYNPFSTSKNIFVGKADHGVNSMLADINGRIAMGENAIEATLSSVYKNTPGFLSELGFGGASRAGRNNLEDMTRAGMVSYQMAARLNTMLSQVGIGLSSASMGSAQDVWANLALKRIVAPMAIGGYALYSNDLIGEITGEKPSQTVGEAYANMTVGMSGLKEITGINAIFESLDRLMPGAKRVFETPLGKVAETATFGLIGNARSSQEQTEYLTEGYDSVRKGRWWGLGSNTPFWGDRIKYWQPSWYRRLMSDYKYTDVYYGEGMERWKNSVLPTLHNPLGGLNPFTWNHYEEKHYDDRPYPVQRSMFANIPLVGDLLDNTVGRITTPFRTRPDLQRQHEAYLREINMMTAYYGTSQVATHLQMSPGGRMTPVIINPTQGGSGVIADQGSQEGGTPVYGDGMQAGLGLVSGEMPIVSPQEFIAGDVGKTQTPYVSTQGGQMPSSGGGYGSIAAREALTKINMEYAGKSNIGKVNVGAIASLKNNDFVDDLNSVANPNSLMHGIGRTLASAQEIEGIYGWMSGFITGDTVPKTVLASSNSMMSLSRQWWDNEMGGDGLGIPGGDGLSELYRRFIPKPNKGQRTYNPIRNTMPDWLPGPEYFTDFKHGDPYAKVNKGEFRLPGEGYESMNKLYSDDIFGEYGAVDRLLILSDIAPYSDQYKYYKGVVSRMREEGMVDDEAWDKVSASKERLREVKKKYDFHPYKFKTADVERKKVTVTKVLDNNTFMVDELPGTPLKLAGLGKLPKGDTGDKANRIRQEIGNVIRPGEKIEVGIAVDKMNAYNSDVKGSMDAVVYTGSDKTLNREIATIAGEKMFGVELEESPIDVKWDSTDPTDVAALYDTAERKFGSVWESFSHMNTFLHSKFLPIRSPLEMYKRKELYGKSWQSWNNPIQDWVVPVMNNVTQANPLVATGTGAFIGYLAGTNKYAKAVGATIGAVIGGGASSVRTVGEAASRMYNFVVPDALEIRDTYIPKRRKTQREINEYFDRLKYVKYMGMYEKARQLAIDKEGVDPEALIQANKMSADEVKQKRGILKAYKKLNGSLGLDSKHNKTLNDALNILDGKKSIVDAGEYTMQALSYYEEATTTVYGADPYGDVSKIIQALPKKDREFYQEFLKASPKEREEILRLIPKDQRKFYQAAWGMEVDKPISNEEYFSKNYLPDASWDGWAPDVAIDDIKIKFLDKVGQELSEYGYWKDDAIGLKNTPTIPKGKSGLKNGSPLNISELHKILRGAGISSSDVVAEVEYSSEPFASPVEISMALEYDRRDEVKDSINKFLPDLLGGW